MQLDNCVQNVVLQLACGYVGAPLHTFKTREALRAAVAACATRVSSDKLAFSHAVYQAEVPDGGAAWDSAPKLYHLGRGDQQDLLDLITPSRAAAAPAVGGAPPHAAAAANAAVGAFYNSTKGLAYAALATHGAAVAARLALTPGDALAVPVPLAHAFGMAGLLAAVQVRHAPNGL
jgi:acyl-CoA synthetase (AMP-forming)/AMP-acid ligase II